MDDILAPRFIDPVAARKHLEALRWPDGPECVHCGSADVTRLEGKKHRDGLLQCNKCREQFTVTVGTVFERSKIALNKWLLCNHLLCASKKGMSALQISRMLGVTYKTAWFMCHRIRESLRNALVIAAAESLDCKGPVDRLRVTSGGGTGLIIEGDTLADGADGHAHLRKPIEAAEDGEAEAIVDHAPLADQLAVPVDLLDIALHRAGEERVGEPLAGDAQGRIPRGGEDGVAAARGISAGNAHARSLACFGDNGGLGEGLTEDRHLLAVPAVVADGGGCRKVVYGSFRPIADISARADFHQLRTLAGPLG